MNEHIKQDDELRPYRKIGLTLLQFMAVLAVLGIAFTVLWKYFFG